MDEWLVLQSFYNGLTTTSRAHLDAAAGGAYLDLTIAKATTLIKKWSPTKAGTRSVPNPELKAKCIPSRRRIYSQQRWTSY
jgi:hypothetical protein